MTVHQDAEEIMKKYRFVPKEKRDFVLETLELAIKHYDTLCLFGFEFQVPKYQEGITVALKNAVTVDEVVDIHNQVAEMLTSACNLIQKVGHETAQSAIKTEIKNFTAEHTGCDPKTHF